MAEESSHFDYQEAITYRGGIVLMLAFIMWVLLQISNEIGIDVSDELMFFVGAAGFLIAGAALLLNVYRNMMNKVRLGQQ